MWLSTSQFYCIVLLTPSSQTISLTECQIIGPAVAEISQASIFANRQASIAAAQLRGDIRMVLGVLYYLIAATADGNWIRKCLKNGIGKSQDGAGVVFDVHTGLILGSASHHRYCAKCNYDRNSDVKSDHKCYGDWQGKTPQSMEADLIAEIFLELYHDFKIIIPLFWGDGDSKTTKHLQDTMPYVLHREPCFVHLIKCRSNAAYLLLKRESFIAKGYHVWFKTSLRRIIMNARAACFHALMRIDDSPNRQDTVTWFTRTLKQLIWHTTDRAGHTKCGTWYVEPHIRYFKYDAFWNCASFFSFNHNFVRC